MGYVPLKVHLLTVIENSSFRCPCKFLVIVLFSLNNLIQITCKYISIRVLDFSENVSLTWTIKPTAGFA